MRAIAALLWLVSLALIGLAGYAYQFKSMPLYMLVLIAGGCFMSMSMFSLLTAPIRYKVGERFFRHHPATILFTCQLGIMLPFALVSLAVVFQHTTGSIDTRMVLGWTVAGTLCNIYASFAAARAASAI